MTLAALTAGITCAAVAQTAATAATKTELTAKSDPLPAPVPDTGTVHASATAAKPQIQPTVADEIEALKTRIDQLEKEVKEAKTAALADSNDTAALKAAEKDLVAGNGTAALPSAGSPSAGEPSIFAGWGASPRRGAGAPGDLGGTTYQVHAVPRRLDLAEQQWTRRGQPHEHKVLHAGISRRCKLQPRFEPPRRRHPGRIDGDFPLQRVSVGADQRRRRHPYRQCARAHPHHGRSVRHDYCPQRRQP